MSYSSIHHKIARWRGSASNYACGICGAPAEAWACFRNKNLQGESNGHPVKYSDDIFDYAPTCRSCNGKLDSHMVQDVCKNGHSDWYMQGKQRRCRTCFNQWQRDKRKSRKNDN